MRGETRRQVAMQRAKAGSWVTAASAEGVESGQLGAQAFRVSLAATPHYSQSVPSALSFDFEL